MENPPAIISEVTAWSSNQSLMVIESQETYDSYSESLKQLKTKAKELEKERKIITEPLNVSLKAVNAMFKKPSEALAKIEKQAKALMVGWVVKQNEIEEEKIKVLREKARQKQEEADAELRKAYQRQALVQSAEDEKETKKAAMLASLAESKQEAAAAMPTEVETTKAGSGNTLIKSWEIEIVNYQVLIEYLVEKKYLGYFKIEEGKIKKLANEREGKLNFPGIKTVEKTDMRTRV